MYFMGMMEMETFCSLGLYWQLLDSIGGMLSGRMLDENQ